VKTVRTMKSGEEPLWELSLCTLVISVDPLGDFSLMSLDVRNFTAFNFSKDVREAETTVIESEERRDRAETSGREARSTAGDDTLGAGEGDPRVNDLLRRGFCAVDSVSIWQYTVSGCH